MDQTPISPQSSARTVGGEIRALVGDVFWTLTHFLRGQIIIASILAAFHLAGFYLVQMPLWWFAGAVVGAFAVVPYIGFVAGALLATLIGALGGMTAGGLLQVWLVLAAGQILETFYLSPKVLGRRLNLNPFAVFAATLVGALFFGPLGAFLAAPAAAVALLVRRRWKASGDVSPSRAGPG